ncbi:hypothetical protein A3A71_03040 [Candidatus Berkelbacteria bacterium RIFCSPLOWO2_01_FULL_50_28]|uniref:Uncharacterized protein n=1 Tax=Candidatus Berkelbacteria bacterium RIFCSPLOWO2_01_FULL_50_28 TaxID=1797471 RepID=A0A1F5ECG2_9BACT|nr:MAG: hypothetical protein A2807_02605 [Candidatus Berkelbacteria bacterium RIFCSPHIGHO2_01_FULL_50_36]OGD63768.1 MAG: hypothetical protein A3F39_03440 [Candidatus Berkelbacteria bacterium RIFCSPHIGHO2_12_FULL_50_11]OGD65041.1 MAG: hypothetical protein A3A71_03040 [Candidatus Berkelbacteria bacterium RIFCSPLOWO2_01_FULL_50_28]
MSSINTSVDIMVDGTLPSPELDFDFEEARKRVDSAKEATPGHTREFEQIRTFLATTVRSAVEAYQQLRENAAAFLIHLSDRAKADLERVKAELRTLLDEQTKLRDEYTGAQALYETACGRAGIQSHAIGTDGLNRAIAAKMRDRYRITGVDIGEYVESTTGVPEEPELIEQPEPNEQSTGSQAWDWALRFVTGTIFGTGLLTLLGLLKDRVIILQPWWLLVALAFGSAITVAAKVFITKEVRAYLRRRYLGDKADSLARGTALFAVAVVTMIVVVEAIGIYYLFAQKAEVAAAISNKSVFSPPMFVLWAIALTSTGLLFGGSIAQARESWEQEKEWLDEVKAQETAYQAKVKAWADLGAAIEKWQPSEAGAIEARALVGRHLAVGANLLKATQAVETAENQIERLHEPVTLPPERKDELVRAYSAAAESIRVFSDAMNDPSKPMMGTAVPTA